MKQRALGLVLIGTVCGPAKAETPVSLIEQVKKLQETVLSENQKLQGQVNNLENRIASLELNKLQIESGTCGFGATHGNGSRVLYKPIKFSKNFKEQPTVVVSTAHADIGSKRNYRVHHHAGQVTQKGFVCGVHVWSDTGHYGSSASWVAYGP